MQTGDPSSLPDRLAALGATVETLVVPERLCVEPYRVVTLREGERAEVRGADVGAGRIIQGEYATELDTVELPAGSFHVFDGPVGSDRSGFLGGAWACRVGVRCRLACPEGAARRV